MGEGGYGDFWRAGGQDVSKLKMNITFLGAGNMAEALVRGVLGGGVCDASCVTVTDVRAERLAFFRDVLKVHATESNRDAAAKADVLVLAVKPQSLADVLKELDGVLSKKTLVLSIAAGITTRWIEDRVAEGTCVVRAMPNTPALVGRGISAICGGRWAAEGNLGTAERILGSVGKVVRVAEKDMDAVTAVSGSGPAYVFFLIEAMMKAAADLGLSDAVARELVNATVEGSARLIMETGVDAAELRARVTSKGGTTAAALGVLAAGGVSEKWVEAIKAAHRRAKELSGG